MSYLYGLLPAGALLFSMPYRCVPEPKVWVVPEKIRAAIWITLAITTGLAGTNLYVINDQEANTVYVGLVFLFGTGWVISTRLCNQWVNLAYVVAVAIVAWWLYARLDKFKTTFEEAKKARSYLIPLLLWMVVVIFLASVALGAYVFKPKQSWRMMLASA